MRAITATFWTSLFLLAVGCGGKSDDTGGDDDDGPDACVGIECQVVNCGAMGLPNTSISGTVFAPNGTLPLNGVTVYVNRDPLPPFTEGVQCDRCSTTLPGSAVTQATSDAFGNFRLENVPAGDNIPLVIVTGKWRRQITIPSVAQCTDTPIGMADTRLPKNKAEGDIPKIALTTGSADSLECLIRKLGIDDAEITPAAGSGRIHYYAGNGVSTISGTPLTSANNLWDTVPALSTYDIVFFSCEGDQRENTKSQNAYSCRTGTTSGSAAISRMAMATSRSPNGRASQRGTAETVTLAIQSSSMRSPTRRGCCSQTGCSMSVAPCSTTFRHEA
jgi:hypothetical protein